MSQRYCWVLLLLFLGSSCHRVKDTIEPKISHTVQDTYLQSLPSAFPPLSSQERSENWGKEHFIGKAFAHKLDLYQALTAFKRAEILAPPSLTKRLEELRYDIFLCYYFGQKYNDVLFEFDRGPLRTIEESFPPFHDLLVILYDSYLKLHKEPLRIAMLETIGHYYPQTKENLAIGTAIIQADFSQLKQFSSKDFVEELRSTYKAHRKSPAKAQLLNTVLPGAGYLYLGQKQSALTAFCLNALFIGATYHFYNHHQIAAGTIFLSFECGWYFGGIFGAGLEAKAYNERLYEELATPVLHQRRLFPILNLKHAF